MNVQPPSETPRTGADRDKLHHFAKDLASFSAALCHLARAGNDRLTMNQVAFFLLVADANARGHPPTLNEVMEAADGVLGQSIKNTYKVLLESEGRRPKTQSALGWLTREPDLEDERRKYLQLTPLGRRVAKEALLKLETGRQ